PINEHMQNRPNYRTLKTGRLTWLVPTNYSTQKSGHKSAGNTEQNGDKATTRIRAWHKKLCNRTDNQPDNQCAKNRCQHNCVFYRVLCVLASARCAYLRQFNQLCGADIVALPNLVQQFFLGRAIEVLHGSR